MNEPLKAYRITVTCDASGDATAYIRGVDCLLYGISFVKGSNSIANTSDITVSSLGPFPVTILTLTNLDVTSTPAHYYPRVDSCGNTGTALSANNILVPVVGDVKVVIAQGGNAGIVDVSLVGV